MAFQIGAGLLDACVLAVLSRGEAYGYILTQDIKGVLDVSESTLYPVLRRLQKDDMLSSDDRPFAGRNRRYYALTEKGAEALAGYLDEWKLYKDSVDRVLLGGEGA